jgi:hypothetical protein
MARKASIGIFGLVLIGIIILATIAILHTFPSIQRFAQVKGDATAFVSMNDEAGKIYPLLSAKVGDESAMDFMACRISGLADCGDMEENLRLLAEEMDTSVVLYDKTGAFETYGEREDGEIFIVEIPLPGGKSGTVGFMLDKPSVQPMVTDWIWPLDTVTGLTVSSCYGEKRVSAKTGRPYTHSGVDLGGAAGDRVYAVSGGTIKYVCTGAVEGDVNGCHGYGNMIVIKHGDYYVRYSHLSKVADDMKENVKVDKGDTIGYMGNTGYSFGSHLDFKVYSYDPGEWGYNANIDPFCMYGEGYLSGTVKLSYAADGEDCSSARSVCASQSTAGYAPAENDE